MNSSVKIYFDNIIFFLQKSGGGSVYWYEIIDRFIKSNQNIDFIEQQIFQEEQNIFRKRLNLNKVYLEKLFPFNVTRYLPLTLKIKEKEKFIFHSSYYRIIKSKNAVNVTTVHDFTYEYYTKGIKKWIHYLQKKWAIKNSDGIICISENTKKDLLKFHPWAKNKNIKVIYNGVGNQFYFLGKESDSILEEKDQLLKKIISEKYILFVGHRTKYKNFDKVIETLSILPENYKLVIVGEDLNKIEKSLLDNLQHRYYHLKGLQIEKLNLLYNKAFCFLYPSSYEGFGIPILESMKVGCPVITTKKSSIPEVAGEAALFVNDVDANQIKEKVLLLEKEKIREDIIQKGLIQSKKFSWDKTYEEVFEFYKELLKEAKR